MKELTAFEYQVKHILDTLKLAARTLDSKNCETCLDRDIMQAIDMTTNILNETPERSSSKARLFSHQKIEIPYFPGRGVMFSDNLRRLCDAFSVYVSQNNCDVQSLRDNLPEYYVPTKLPDYDSETDYTISDLESYCEEFTEYAHQQSIIKQKLTTVNSI